MKPFNLERAIAGDPVVTRDGRKVLHVFYADKMPENSQRLIALIENYDTPDFYYECGTWSGKQETNNDLFMATKKTKLYISINLNQLIMDGKAYAASNAHLVKENLSKYGNHDNKIIEIEVEI